MRFHEALKLIISPTQESDSRWSNNIFRLLGTNQAIDLNKSLYLDLYTTICHLPLCIESYEWKLSMMAFMNEKHSRRRCCICKLHSQKFLWRRSCTITEKYLGRRQKSVSGCNKFWYFCRDKKLFWNKMHQNKTRLHLSVLCFMWIKDLKKKQPIIVAAISVHLFSHSSVILSSYLAT